MQDHREAAAGAVVALGEDGARDALAAATAALAGRAPFAAVHERLVALSVELDDAIAELRHAHDTMDEDPERLAEVRVRRHLLHELRRKYGETLAEVIAYREETEQRLAELEAHDQRVAELEGERAAAERAEAAAAAVVGRARRAAAPELAGAIQDHLNELAMPKARVDVAVSDDPEGHEVTFLLAANPGDPPQPLARVASGGELARAMLAVRLVLTEAPDTLLFDEVDAGVGGEAALAVGRALARLGQRHQVLVVTHLAQVAASAAVPAGRGQAGVRRAERGRGPPGRGRGAGGRAGPHAVGDERQRLRPPPRRRAARRGPGGGVMRLHCAAPSAGPVAS